MSDQKSNVIKIILEITEHDDLRSALGFLDHQYPGTRWSVAESEGRQIVNVEILPKSRLFAVFERGELGAVASYLHQELSIPTDILAIKVIGE